MTEVRSENLGPLDEVKDNLNAASSLDVVQAVEWLSHFGYLAPSVMTMGPALATVNIVDAIHEMQSMAGLPLSGHLDDATLKKMGEPRCGHPDVIRSSDGNIQRLIERARWRKTSLSYFVGAHLPNMPQADQEADIAESFDEWVRAAAGGIVRVDRTDNRDAADIVLLTGTGRGQGFDGPGGTLAWMYLPPGDDRQIIGRWDLAERWVRAGSGGIIFSHVCKHELGHAFGLEHSRDPSDLMAPFYSPAVGSLRPGDIARIRALYPSVGPQNPPPLPPPNPPRDWKPLHEPFTMGVSELAICTRQATVSAT